MGNERLPTSYLSAECRCNELVRLWRAWTAPLTTATPHHFAGASHAEDLCGKACAEEPCPARRVQPEPEPNWPKVCVITSSIIIAKALPFAHYALRTFEGSVNHSKAAALSLLRLPHGCKNHHGDPPAQRAPHGTI